MISIHALREEGDAGRSTVLNHPVQFLSTPSARRATKSPRSNQGEKLISIHALREEGDSGRTPEHHDASNFYPRPPRGGRPRLSAGPCMMFRISIHALREEGDVCRANAKSTLYRISIHALREEGDVRLPAFFLLLVYFYPRPPRGGRPLTSRPKSTAI